MSTAKATAHAAATATDLVNYVNTLLDLSEKNPLELSADIKKGAWGAVVAAVLPKAQQLFDLDAETDVEGAFRMLFDVLILMPKDEVVAKAKEFVNSVLVKADDKAVLRLRIATYAFNKSVGLTDFRFETMMQVLEFADKSEKLSLLSSYYEDIESLFEPSSLKTEQRRKLLVKVADILTKEDSKSVKVLLVLEKYLATFIGVTDAKELASGKDVAVRAAQLVVANPVSSFVARVDIASNPAVAALKSDSKHGKLVELLEIMSTKTLTEYCAFKKAAGSFYKDHGLSEEECADHMRLFTLCAMSSGFDEIPYATLAKALDVKEDEVEQWVVKAITSNLISAKVDQLRRTVVISRTLPRGFGLEEWKEVDVKLHMYKKNVGQLLEMVRNARQAHEKK